MESTRALHPEAALHQKLCTLHMSTVRGMQLWTAQSACTSKLRTSPACSSSLHGLQHISVCAHVSWCLGLACMHTCAANATKLCSFVLMSWPGLNEGTTTSNLLQATAQVWQGRQGASAPDRHGEMAQKPWQGGH